MYAMCKKKIGFNYAISDFEKFIILPISFHLLVFQNNSLNQINSKSLAVTVSSIKPLEKK
jgi:hypothetical protein